MKCVECNYNHGTVEVAKCVLTGEEHTPDFECNCDFIRTRRDREAKLLGEKAVAIETLEALRQHSITKPRVNAQHVIDILTDTAKESGIKIAEAIEYLEDFV